MLVVTGFGVNSDDETARAATLAGADRVEQIHFADIVAGECNLDNYDFLVFPGGFLDGDRLGAAQAAAMRWRFMRDQNGQLLLDKLAAFVGRGALILGICNGFQLLVKIGLLPAFKGSMFERQISLGHNDSGKYEDRWVRLRVNPDSPCIFTKGLTSLYLPVRHGEGKLVCSAQCLDMIRMENLIALQYINPLDSDPTEAYPYNPNGSPDGIAGITNPDGHILGLMPHPEAFHHATNHPGWTRGEMDPPGTLLFVNAIKYLHSL